MKKLLLICLSIFCFGNTFAQKNYSEQISALVESKKFRINILNVYREKSTPLPVYSSHYVEINGEKIVADFPYFVRKDNPAEISTNNVALSSEVFKYKAKHNKKKGYWLLNFSAQAKKSKEYKLEIVIQPDGYCVIVVNSPNKTRVLYDGQVKF